MDLQELEIEVERLIGQVDIPGADITESLVQLAKSGNWIAVREYFGEDAAFTWQHEYESDPEEFCARLTKIADECRRSFASNSSKRLTDLSRTNFVPGVKISRVEKLQRMFDSSEDMLQVAFARRVFDLIEPAASRAAQLRELVVREASSREADRYLTEACECYYFGFYTACVVICRSLLEEALERKLPNDLLNQWRGDAKTRNCELTLGSLLYRVRNHRREHGRRPLVPNKFLDLADQVNKTGTRAAHAGPITPDEARDCFLGARDALLALLGGVQLKGT